MLYEFFVAKLAGGKSAYEAKVGRRFKPATRLQRTFVEKIFSELVHAMPGVQNPKKVATAFKNVFERARPSRDESQTLLAAIGPLKRAAKKSH